ncbi:MAG TPA: hypothetical protein PLG50_00320 [bacterium]|nr:hypothetical protein [bacterium]HQI48422.1 hypothetical protein [bacterium]HQJ63218.1 hypothetical protein [bacterium]
MPALFLMLIFAAALAAAPISADSAATAPPLLVRLDGDIADGRLDDYSLIQAAFILSGATVEDSLRSCLSWYDDLLERLRGCHLDPFQRLESASTIFSYLHSFCLREYKEEATTLLDVVRRQKYNCVAGTILYNLVCDDLGFRTEAFETPSHVYTIFADFTQTVTVENTSPMGFNIMRNLRAYSAYLLGYYPKNRAAQIGLDRIYAYENSRGRRISNTELLGLLAYNRAYFAQRENDFASAYAFVLLAQAFNRDSRSNIQFEQDLYFRWGRTLFQNGEYDRAFSVFADGTYRYRDMKELAQNCRAAFFQGLRKHRMQGDWPASRRLIEEMAGLDLLDPPQQAEQTAILAEWAEDLYRRADRKSLLECLDLLSAGDQDRWNALRRAAEALPE